MKTTKQLGTHVRLITVLPRADALDVMRFAEQQNLTVSRLLRSIIVPLCKELLAKGESGS